MNLSSLRPNLTKGRSGERERGEINKRLSNIFTQKLQLKSWNVVVQKFTHLYMYFFSWWQVLYSKSYEANGSLEYAHCYIFMCYVSFIFNLREITNL